jgi:hypothetical protein
MEALGAGLGACAFFGFLTAVSLAGIWQERRKTEIVHLERMKRFEMGLPDLPSDRAWPKALVCIAIGAGVPVTAFVVTLIAYLNKGMVRDDGIWAAPTFVSMFSVVSGGCLARHLLGKASESGRPPEAAGPLPVGGAKPAADPDAFDVVGRRG